MKLSSKTPLNRVKRCRPLLGTFVEITAAGFQSEEQLHAMVGKAFDLITFTQSLMSFHDAASDVSRLNQCARIAPLKVHPWTLHVLERARALSAATEGAFDITVTPRLAEETGGWQDIEVRGNGTVYFQKPLLLDLSGIAKGFAVDKAADYLATLGLQSAVVNAGGDLRVLGAGPHEAGIRHPGRPHGELAPAIMPRAAVATSAGYFSNRRQNGRRVSPIVHPRTGKPLRSTTSVSVFAPNCLLADALTRAVFFAPQEIWTRALAAYDSLALFLTAKGEEVHFPAFGPAASAAQA